MPIEPASCRMGAASRSRYGDLGRAARCGRIASRRATGRRSRHHAGLVLKTRPARESVTSNPIRLDLIPRVGRRQLQRQRLRYNRPRSLDQLQRTLFIACNCVQPLPAFERRIARRRWNSKHGVKSASRVTTAASVAASVQDQARGRRSSGGRFPRRVLQLAAANASACSNVCPIPDSSGKGHPGLDTGPQPLQPAEQSSASRVYKAAHSSDLGSR